MNKKNLDMYLQQCHGLCKHFILAAVHTLVTVDASPALLAYALPRFITGTMFTGWMEFTHITKETLPAFSASVHTKVVKG